MISHSETYEVGRMADAKEDYRKWIFEGNCPCCFPYWEYEDGTWFKMTGWSYEFDAWAVYDEIVKEYDD